VTGQAKNHDPIIENFTLVEFNRHPGQPFSQVIIKSGHQLTDLHHYLMSQYIDSENVLLPNEADWVARHHHGNLLEYYKQFLSLTVVNCIMLEFYAVEDAEFVNDILVPAVEFVENTFGHKPLIAELITPAQEFEKNWLAYPKEVKHYMNDFIHKP
jgi:hypothetical protein